MCTCHSLYTLTGFPDFGKIFDFPLDFSFPTIDYKLNMTLWDPVNYIRWPCLIQVSCCSLQATIIKPRCRNVYEYGCVVTKMLNNIACQQIRIFL